MRVLVICTVLLLAGSGFASNAGQPLCRSPRDFAHDWSNKNDPKTFWKCVSIGKAELQKCNTGTTFNEQFFMCTIPGMIIAGIDTPNALINCEQGQVISLNGAQTCVDFACDDGTIVYDPEGSPTCFRETDRIQLCPGAGPEKRVFGTEDCTIPKCTVNEYLSEKFFPSSDPTEYFRCAHENVPVSFKCPQGLCFDAKSSVCNWPYNWDNVCA